MTFKTKVIHLMVFSISLVTSLGPGHFPGPYADLMSRRQCRKVEVSLPNSDPIFYPVPAPFDRKYYFIPFTIDTSKVIVLNEPKWLTHL